MKIPDKNSVLMSAIDIFSLAIKEIKEHFEEAIKGRGVPFEAGKVLHVVTVPAIWSESAKNFMKKAAIKVHE